MDRPLSYTRARSVSVPAPASGSRWRWAPLPPPPRSRRSPAGRFRRGNCAESKTADRPPSGRGDRPQPVRAGEEDPLGFPPAGDLCCKRRMPGAVQRWQRLHRELGKCAAPSRLYPNAATFVTCPACNNKLTCWRTPISATAMSARTSTVQPGLPLRGAVAASISRVSQLRASPDGPRRQRARRRAGGADPSRERVGRANCQEQFQAAIRSAARRANQDSHYRPRSGRVRRPK
jgi:hypothetical protein